MFSLPHSASPQPSKPSVTDLRSILQALPKVDLHRHLEGSLRLETLANIAQEHGMDLPSRDIEELRQYVQFTAGSEPNFHSFLEKFKLLRRFYPTRQAIERITYEAIADAAMDNVKYLELRFNPVALAHTGRFQYGQVMDWVWAAACRAQTDNDITVRLIVSVIRQEAALAEQVVAAALKRMNAGIVAIDLSGDEVNYPLAPFVNLFKDAQEAGMGITVHAGEAAGPESVREALEQIHPQRIGHGVRSAEDPSVVQMVVDSNVALEMCITSNLQTGVMTVISHHPLGEFYRMGVNVTINTDDPSVSDTTLTDEYVLAVAGIGLHMADLKKMILTAANVSFLSSAEKTALVSRLQTALGV